MSALPRAFCKIENIWRHVYILGRFEQTTLDGQVVPMATVKLVKNAQVTYDVEASRLEAKRPRTPRKRATSLS